MHHAIPLCPGISFQAYIYVSGVCVVYRCVCRFGKMCWVPKNFMSFVKKAQNHLELEPTTSILKTERTCVLVAELHSIPAKQNLTVGAVGQPFTKKFREQWKDTLTLHTEWSVQKSRAQSVEDTLGMSFWEKGFQRLRIQGTVWTVYHWNSSRRNDNFFLFCCLEGRG